MISVNDFLSDLASTSSFCEILLVIPNLVSGKVLRVVSVALQHALSVKLVLAPPVRRNVVLLLVEVVRGWVLVRLLFGPAVRGSVPAAAGAAAVAHDLPGGVAVDVVVGVVHRVVARAPVHHAAALARPHLLVRGEGTAVPSPAAATPPPPRPLLPGRSV